MDSYLPVFIFIALLFLIAGGVFIAAIMLAPKKPNKEKCLPYEGGFNAFSDARGTFPVRFYLQALLFLLFGIGIVFLFPWALVLGKIGAFGFWSMVLFLSFLAIAFVYSWKRGALEEE